MPTPGNAETFLLSITCGKRTEISHWKVMGVGYQRDHSAQVEVHWLLQLPWAAAALKASVTQVKIRFQGLLLFHLHLCRHGIHKVNQLKTAYFHHLHRNKTHRLGVHSQWLIYNNVSLLQLQLLPLINCGLNQSFQTNLTWKNLFAILILISIEFIVGDGVLWSLLSSPYLLICFIIVLKLWHAFSNMVTELWELSSYVTFINYES